MYFKYINLFIQLLIRIFNYFYLKVYFFFFFKKTNQLILRLELSIQLGFYAL
jgi:hypothetical protein